MHSVPCETPVTQYFPAGQGVGREEFWGQYPPATQSEQSLTEPAP
jgi:hypothetical protein